MKLGIIGIKGIIPVANNSISLFTKKISLLYLLEIYLLYLLYLFRAFFYLHIRLLKLQLFSQGNLAK